MIFESYKIIDRFVKRDGEGSKVRFLLFHEGSKNYI
jgi:hypothetical protein